MEQDITPFDRPIPGQSLTGEPRNNPWENPAQMSEMEDVTKFYIERLSNEEIVDDIAVLCQSGIPLKPIVQSIVSSGNIRGMHTVDAGMLVSPIIHQFLRQAITMMGIEVDDDGIDYQKEAEEKELERFKVLALKYLEDNPDDTDPGKQLLKEVVEEETTPEESKPQGLMAKG
tara:strand:- start:4738 stop:5256 length:519 start_codon:yes stop_codon:yes gene_type:complete